ncbi:Uncharacterized protein SAMN05444008_102235 [Cnuella takakiae]|uniref:Photosynthesis system II assembly factor Ycf48/Hcf136-like domain-containing protein n=1 Tax=Cnuella takakiae TaxID=1302690 RepID=A0A1M4VE76_9BACT|nr:oxidoreductase [Cnuella takakiae]OLY92628.1 oxidoreductase [Cnuella takakiae]SHE67198.1 Uncharacterized protein SAMN05444008_102235 [Cnuella takakiae]
MRPLFSLIFLLLTATTFAQHAIPTVELLTEGTKTSLRGLSVVNDKIVWASGSGGMVARSTDGGKTWKWVQVKGYEKKEFRDIEAFDATRAIIMAIDTPAYLLKTVDGGETWKVVYENHQPGMFLDAMSFWNNQAGMVIGDPIDGKVFVARSLDEGNSWLAVPQRYLPVADSGEAFFAASGTNVRSLDRDESVMVSGGMRSSIFIRGQKITLPLVQGSSTAGANSVALMDPGNRKSGSKLVVVGGDFNKPASDSLNCFWSNNGGKTWQAPAKGPRGYRSCVEYLGKNKLVTCGLTGVDLSTDGGRNWSGISNIGFHTVAKAKDGTAVFFCGGNGRIGKLVGSF